MFCPLGYKSVAELWDIYQAKRLAAAYQSATRYYNAKDFLPAHVRGSPLDICEHTFLKSLSMTGLCLASPQGQVVNLHSPLVDGHKSLFSVLHYVASSYHAGASFFDDDGNILSAVAGEHYQSFGGEAIQADWWQDKYPLVSSQDESDFYQFRKSLWFHCLPFCFERWGYTVVEKLPPWADVHGATTGIERIVRNFGGWAICLANEAVERWQPYLDGKSAYSDEQEEMIAGGQIGRPVKLAAARAVFERMGFDKGKLSWAQVRAKINRETGDSPSDKTLRDWRDAYLKGLSPRD